MGIVVDSRIAAAVSRHKPTVCQRRKAAVLGAVGPVRRTPPGYESGDCLHRGSAGTWEHPLSPCTTPGLGDRATTGPGVTGALHPGHEPDEDPTHAVQPARYREASEKRSDPRWAGGSLRGASSRCRWGTATHGTHGREGNAGQNVGLEGPLGATPGSPTVSMTLQSMAQQAQRSPALVCNTVLHLIDHDVLREAYRLTRKHSAPGGDQVTATQSAEPLDDTRRDLHERLCDNRYVAPPVERGWIAKDDGKKRPRGQPCFEDKMVQRAVAMILEAIFEPDFQ